MTREIKFRAWDLEKGAWFAIQSGIDTICHTDPAFIFELGRDDLIIQQYTGLKDKNGKEIYEGDILVCRVDKDWQRYTSEVVIEPILGFGTRLGSGSWNGQLSTWLSHGCEIVGNIFENPELLK